MRASAAGALVGGGLPLGSKGRPNRAWTLPGGSGKPRGHHTGQCPDHTCFDTESASDAQGTRLGKMKPAAGRRRSDPGTGSEDKAESGERSRGWWRHSASVRKGVWG